MALVSHDDLLGIFSVEVVVVVVVGPGCTVVVDHRTGDELVWAVGDNCLGKHASLARSGHGRLVDVVSAGVCRLFRDEERVLI